MIDVSNSIELAKNAYFLHAGDGDITSQWGALALSRYERLHVTDPTEKSSDTFAGDSNAQMQDHFARALGDREAELESKLSALADMLSDEQRKALSRTQQAWHAYRAALQDYSRLQFSDGTNGPLAAVSAALSETERRICEIDADIVEKSASG
jgi:uncharacterized protein YecT (DUF1311 family)